MGEKEESLDFILQLFQAPILNQQLLFQTEQLSELFKGFLYLLLLQLMIEVMEQPFDKSHTSEFQVIIYKFMVFIGYSYLHLQITIEWDVNYHVVFGSERLIC